MLFCGYGFFKNDKSLDYTPTFINGINTITIKNGIFDDLYIIGKIINYTIIDPNKIEWDFDTILHAKFEGNLFVGNVDWGKDIEKVRIKRREKNTHNWLTLFDVEIDDADDFKFEKFDKYARSQTWYEYALVPIVGGIEGNFSVNEVYSEFDGMFITEKDLTYGTRLETSLTNIKKVNTYTVVDTVYGQYPYTIRNGNNRYYSGTASGFFTEDLCEKEEIVNTWKFREKVEDFLTNGQAKILKYYDGRMWLIIPSMDIIEEDKGHNDFVATSFDWVEVGDAENNNDLYNFGLIDVYESE